MVMSAPQTQRLNANLSVDIPPYSNVSSPVSSPSPSFSASAFNSPRQYDSVPPSPTISGSWNVNKSHAELTSLLKEAYGVIRDREKDLTLAAEIGKSLLENNIALKSKYESTIVQLQHLQRARTKASTFTIQHQIGDKHATPIAPPNTSFMEEPMEFDESDTESLQAWSSSHDFLASGEAPFKRKNREHQNSGLNYKDLENIKELEIRNQELHQQLDDALRDNNDRDKSNKAKVRKLEADVKHFQDECLMASQQIEDLERENERLVQKQKAEFWNIKYNKKSNDNDDIIDALVQRVQELEDQNILLERSKSEIERRCSRLTAELETLQMEFNELLQTTDNYEMLQIDNLRKDEIISELSESLEEQRALVVNYRSGIWTQKNSRANSVSDGSIMSKAIRRLSDPDGMRAMFGVAPKQNSQDSSIRKTLLSELENEWFRELTMFKRDVKKGNGESDTSPPFSPISSETDLKDFFISSGARPDDDNFDNLTLDYLSDDEFSFLDEFDVENEKANQQRAWFWRRWARALVRFLRTIWRWCRFIFFLIAGLFLALYRGPDYLLPNEL